MNEPTDEARGRHGRVWWGTERERRRLRDEHDYDVIVVDGFVLKNRRGPSGKRVTAAQAGIARPPC